VVALSIPVAERSKASVCGCSLAGIAGSNPAGGMDVYVVCISTDKRQNARLSRQRRTNRVQENT
jgi:hypothetical protein